MPAMGLLARALRCLCLPVVCAMAPVGAAGPSVAGLWSGFVDAMGSSLMLDLRVEGATVRGTATRTGPRGDTPLVVSGRWTPPTLRLRVRGDGIDFEIDARQTGPEQLDGSLVWSGHSRQPLTLVRP